MEIHARKLQQERQQKQQQQQQRRQQKQQQQRLTTVALRDEKSCGSNGLLRGFLLFAKQSIAKISR